MAWTRLADRINLPDMPLVLAGPMLRKVTQSSVTVWVAVKEPTTVSLEVRVTDNLADPPIGTVDP